MEATQRNVTFAINMGYTPAARKLVLFAKRTIIPDSSGYSAAEAREYNTNI